MDSVISGPGTNSLRTEPRDGPIIVYDYIARRRRGRPNAPGKHRTYANQGRGPHQH